MHTKQVYACLQPILTRTDDTSRLYTIILNSYIVGVQAHLTVTFPDNCRKVFNFIFPSFHGSNPVTNKSRSASTNGSTMCKETSCSNCVPSVCSKCRGHKSIDK